MLRQSDLMHSLFIYFLLQTYATFPVLLQLQFTLKLLVTRVARERRESRVFPRVRDEVRGLTEALVTYCTLVRFLTCPINVKV